MKITKEMWDDLNRRVSALENITTPMIPLGPRKPEIENKILEENLEKLVNEIKPKFRDQFKIIK